MPNGAFQGSKVSHSGQLFFDQWLISEVEKTYPYNTNRAGFIKNEQDGIMGAEADTTDPVVNYMFLGEKVEHGIAGFITVGVDPDRVSDILVAANIDEHGIGRPGRPKSS